MIDPGKETVSESRLQSGSGVEAQLRAEIESLKRELQEHKSQAQRPSSRSLVLIALMVVVLVTCGFFLGYVPRQRREKVLAAESREQGQTLPVVNVATVKRSAAETSL